MTALKIGITGASGNIGAKLRDHLRGQGADLLLLDRDPRGDPEVVPADIAQYRSVWVSRLAGIDVLVHLAAIPHPAATWDQLEPHNIVATLNVLQAAMEQQVSRVVLASSVQAVVGRLGRQTRIDEQGPGAPINFYGASKCVAERLGEHYARHFGLSVIALRIGWVQAGDNLPGPHMGLPEYQGLWLSNRDVCRGIECAIRAPEVRFGVFNLVSDNQGMPWDLAEAARVLGWTPQDRSWPQAPAPLVSTPGNGPSSGLGNRLTKPLRWLLRRLR